MMMIAWKTSDKAVVATGSLDPRSSVGSAYCVKGRDLYILTWRGSDEWESKWFIEDDCIKFDYIKSPEGTVINWGSGKALRRFIPSRHTLIVQDYAKEEGKNLFDREVFL